MEIRDYSQTYQRNGVGGQGSWLARFQANALNPERFETFIAVMWTSPLSNGYIKGDDTPTECHVVRLMELGEAEDLEDVEKWRSTDYFLPEILPHYHRVYAEWLGRISSRARKRETV